VPHDATLPAAERLLQFWLTEIGPEGWYKGGAGIDDACRAFGPLWDQAREGALGPWLTDARGALAYLILTDQIPRNIHRGRADGFATDRMARAAAVLAVNRGWDLDWQGDERQFFYMPFEHSEDMSDQDRAVALFAERLPHQTDNLFHAQVHRAVIRRFGRFPGRNAALGRADTPEEAAWLAEGGYAAEVRRQRAGGAP
jgi:uncharacterized protein (DUF924 family)